jgi:hypothetical protein
MTETEKSADAAFQNSDKHKKAPSAFWKNVRNNIKLRRRTLPAETSKRPERIPLSFGQERLWLVEQLGPKIPLHNLRAIFHLKGALDVAAFQKSIMEITRRHETLRTSFPNFKGEPFQSIAKKIVLEWRVEKLSELSDKNREDKISEIVSKEALKFFDLKQGPLLRIKLLHIARDEYIFIKTTHHIINDKWSDSIFMRELALFYTSFSQNSPAPSLPDLPAQQADFACFERKRFEKNGFKSQLEYWQGLLKGGFSPLRLPVDYPSAKITGYRGRSHHIIIPDTLRTAFEVLSHQEEISMFVIFVSAFSILLYQYSGQNDFIVCYPVASRNHAELRNLIGYFNNLLPLPVNFEKNTTFRKFFKQISDITSNSTEHQEISLKHLAESMNIPGIILSRVMFAMQNVPSQPLKMGDINITPTEREDNISNFDLSLSIKKKGEEIVGILRYKTELFKESTIKKFSKNFIELLGKIISNPDQPLSNLPLFKKQSPETWRKPDDYAPVTKESEGEEIRHIWEEVLGIEQIGIHTDLFRLGARSLAIVSICAKMSEKFNRNISVPELLKYPTISEMKKFLNIGKNQKKESSYSSPERIKLQRKAMNRQKKFLKNIRGIDND